MPGTIVAGYDGTAGCQAAMDEALRLAGELSADLVVVFAYAAGPVGGEAADLLAVLRERGNPSRTRRSSGPPGRGSRRAPSSSTTGPRRRSRRSPPRRAPA